MPAQIQLGDITVDVVRKEIKNVHLSVHPPTGRFYHMEIVPVSQPRHEGSSPSFRSDVIDLSVPRQIASYDKLGCRSLLSSVKDVLFGSKSARMTQERCGAYFDESTNFQP